MFRQIVSQNRLLLATMLLVSTPLMAPAQGAPKPTAEMQAVLDKLKELQAKPVATLTVPEARLQARAADAAKVVQRDKRISPAPAASELAPKHAAMLKQLDAANGADFQTLYVDMQAQAHMEAVGLFRTYAGSGDDKAVVAFANETLPTLKMHMTHVKELVGPTDGF